MDSQASEIESVKSQGSADANSEEVRLDLARISLLKEHLCECIEGEDETVKKALDRLRPIKEKPWRKFGARGGAPPK